MTPDKGAGDVCPDCCDTGYVETIGGGIWTGEMVTTKQTFCDCPCGSDARDQESGAGLHSNSGAGDVEGLAVRLCKEVQIFGSMSWRLINPDGPEATARIETLEAEVARLKAQRDAAVEALEPFASFAQTFVDEEGWAHPPMRERIVDWFGPSEFGQAAATLAQIKQEPTA